jgi:ATP-dependent Clp protease ATP-binding subunit ClpA
MYRVFREEGRGVAAQTLTSLGVAEEAVRQQVEEVVGRGQHGPQRGHIPFLPRAKKALELSLREAIGAGSNSIGTEHLLLGLIRDGESPASEILNRLGADPDRVRHELIRRMPGNQGRDEPETGGAAAGGGRRRQLAALRTGLDALAWRVSALEQRVGTGPDIGELDREITQVRLDKERAVDAQDFETAAILRDRERQLLDERAARQQEWASLPSLSDEVERLRDLLRRHGIDPQDGAA